MSSLRAFLPALAIAATLATPAPAETSTLRFQNTTLRAVTSIHASPLISSTWGENRLGDRMLFHFESQDVIFQDENQCVYELLIQFDTGPDIRDKVNVCVTPDFVIVD